MRKIPHLKKVLVGSAFAGAFFLGNPAAGAQELPTIPELDSAGIVDQVRADLASVGIETKPVDAELTDAIDTAVNGAAAQAAQDASAAAASAQNFPVAREVVDQAQLPVFPDAPAYTGADAITGDPLTNPEPIGLLQEATQPEFVPKGTDPNYVWKNDSFSKLAAGKPQADYVLHRVPGSFYDAPQIPEESNTAMTEGKSLYGPGTPLYISEDTMCTLTAAGTDAQGRKVGITAGHCGNVGDPVSSADSWQVGPTGTLVTKNTYLDYSVIEFGSKAEVTRSYNGVTAYGVGGAAQPGEVACKRGVATGTTCGMTFQHGKEISVNQVCAMVGDSGAPVFRDGRIVGSVSRGLFPGLPSCRTPWQGALHNPTVVSNTDAIVADLNRRGEVGSGFTLPEN
ncbi:S1 family peptidase [Corynebacterium aurimucosum]|uniref:Putative secreted protein n=1 Tax=Corynebacterium aurimucosum (strain ATCC 700975 / DSM 44827 / CIP 107346 / CN-1) TaxID=548476 RepID=C3PES1_CORA7|nr:S1 family peptidase [Corynebacterium aurimucosum]ACP32325.1 putative secreted protein [Corynebacterium aurimucosum ATCC 700975]QQU93487.1 serine protease [Corynebacterium aurimucosum]